MRIKRNEYGELSLEQLNNRFLNILQLIHLKSSYNRASDTYDIPSDIFEKLETELDFNTTESTEKKIIEQQKVKYRKRKSYIFWWGILSDGNYQNYESAARVLNLVFKETQFKYQSMTHVRYALETLQLALDDYFGTNKLKITPSRFLTRNVKSKKRSTKCKPKTKKTKSTMKKAMTSSLNSSLVPF